VLEKRAIKLNRAGIMIADVDREPVLLEPCVVWESREEPERSEREINKRYLNCK